MDKKIAAGLLGAVAALGAASSTLAAPVAPPTDVLHASSYADLLKPIPNAGAILNAVDERDGSTEAKLQTVQYHHHHHHHHRTVVIKRHRHHHHHHHQ